MQNTKQKRFEELGWYMFQNRDLAFIVYNGKVYLGKEKLDFHSEILRRVMEENGIESEADFTANNKIAFGYLFQEENGPCAVFHQNTYFEAMIIVKRKLNWNAYVTCEKDGYLYFNGFSQKSPSSTNGRWEMNGFFSIYLDSYLSLLYIK